MDSVRLAYLAESSAVDGGEHGSLDEIRADLAEHQLKISSQSSCAAKGGVGGAIWVKYVIGRRSW